MFVEKRLILFIAAVVQYIFLDCYNLLGSAKCHRYCNDPLSYCEPGSVVGITTGYGLDGPEIESRWGRDFPHLYRLSLGPTQAPVPHTPSSAVVMKE